MKRTIHGSSGLRRFTLCAGLSVGALALHPGAAHAQTPEPTPVGATAASPDAGAAADVGAPVRNGFALGLSFDVRPGVNLSASSGTSGTSIGSLGGGLFAGYKLDRFVFGLRIDYAVADTSSSSGGSNRVSIFTFEPGVQ